MKKKFFLAKIIKNIAIDNLSTGEKQIVFRGSSLLKNVNAIEDGVVLIDEPELSLHPKWQIKILKYYRDLFLLNSKQTAQMFFATHSEYIIDAALRDKENILIIVLSDHNGKIEKYYINNFSVLPETTYAEINYFAFHMPTRDYFMQLYGYLQSIKSIGKIKDMDDFIFNNCENFDKDFYYKNCKYNNTEYFTLPTYIRNSISHPNQNNKFDNTELNRGIIILIRILGNLKKQN